MKLSEIKKILQEKNPPASLQFIRKGVAYYVAQIDELKLNFEIPISEMGDSDFFSWMYSKHLIQWLKQDSSSFTT